MKKILYPNMINECLNDIWNKATDEDCMVWVDFVSGGTVCLEWNHVNEPLVTRKYLSDVIYIIFSNFEDVEQISSPICLIERDKFNQRLQSYKERNNEEYKIII